MPRADTPHGSTSIPSYSFVAGPGGKGLDDYFSPEVRLGGRAAARREDRCRALPAPRSATRIGASAWNSSFANIQCYDAIKVNALLNQIAGKTHYGAPAVVPAVFGMNFQSVYIGQSRQRAGRGRRRLPERGGRAQRAAAERDRVCGRRHRRYRQRAEGRRHL